jgi:hypothetical protein
MSVSPYDIPPRRNPDGSACCEFFDSAGPRLTLACDACQQHYLHELERRRDAAAPNPYTVGLAKLRADSATPERDFEDRYKAARLRDLAAESARRHPTAPVAQSGSPWRSRMAELSAYAPPDAYAAGLKVLRAKEGR